MKDKLDDTVTDLDFPPAAGLAWRPDSFRVGSEMVHSRMLLWLTVVPVA